MRRLIAVLAVFPLLATACIGGAGDERTVLVDFSHDEFATIMVGNFPGEVEVTPGMTLVFKQTWTGEPHTVTGGTQVNRMMDRSEPFRNLFGGFEELMASGADLPDPEQEPDEKAADLFRAVDAAENEEAKRKFIAGYDALRERGLDLPPRDEPGDTTLGQIDEVIGPAAEEFFEGLGLPWAMDEDEDGNFAATQNAGQPCYLKQGGPPEDAGRPCRDTQQRQPIFDGSASYYNSGIIPYEGPQGNTFRVQLAEDIEPGSYFFYCAVHGPDQSTEVKVRRAGSDVPSQGAVSRGARDEIAGFSEPMVDVWRDARDGELDMNGETVDGPFAGLSVPVFGAINEFVPRTIRTEVGEPVTWKTMGWDHTITFGVPEYFPIIRFAEDGRVSLNPRLAPPAGGAPEIPEQEGEGILRIDGGTYDGRGFFSSGLFSAEPYAEYTLRFSRPGTYKYACLLHPPMVGTVEVTR